VKCSREDFTLLSVLTVGVGITCNLTLGAQGFDSNGLWLDIALTNNTAAFTVHALTTNTDGVYDLYFKTNLIDDQDWTWLSRCASGRTNLTVNNLPPGQGFFRLGITNAIRPGFDQQFLDRNDDGSTGIVPMGFFINYFGSSNAMLYVNNNGNVTFGDALSIYAPTPLNQLGQSGITNIIAPYWADVDTRNTASDVVKYGTNMVDGHAAFGVDWVNVGYYNSQADKLLSCQLVIIDRSDITPGDFDMEFNYFKVQWEWGSASSNVPPRAGYSDGIDDYELPGSGVEGAFLDTNVVTGLIYHNLNSSVPGRYFFCFRNGKLLP
jgi:hypothetical protein